MEFKYDHLPHYLSLGAGVQSSTLALMYGCGELTPMPVGSIFADTGAEPKSVYKWLDWLEQQLPFPVHRVQFKDLQTEFLRMKTTKDGRKFSSSDIPVYTLNEKTGQQGAIPNRTCTRDYKIRPINKFLRKAAGIKRGETEPQLQRLKGKTDNFHATPFLHNSRKPLDEIDFRSDVERGQMLLWDDECEGMCGI